jgi:EmrB/QacA subfamily drug resistance transporter
MTSLSPPSTRSAAPASRAGLALLLACGGTFLSFLDATVTNLAVPAVGEDFGVGVAALAWVVTAYAIPFAALLAPAGAIADAVGRVRLYLGGVGLFTLASVLAAAAPSYEVLVGARALQGLGAALLVPASLGLLLAEVPPERRQAAIGLWSATGALAAGAGPVLGGVAVDWIGWRALFCINLPIGLWLLWRGRALLLGEQRGGRAPELLGSLLLAVGVAAVVHGLTEGPARGWDGYVWLTFVVAAAALAGAVARGLRHARPALRVDLLRGRTFATATAVSTAYGAALYAPMLVGVLLLTGPWGYTALEAGLAMTPTCVVVAVVAIGIGRLPAKPSPRVLAASGMALMALAAGLIALGLSPEPELWSLWIPTGILIGTGTGLATVGISSAAALSVAPVHFAAATGLVMAARQVGGALGVAGLAVVLSEVGGTTTPYVVVYLGVAAVAVLGALGGLGLRMPMQQVAVERAQ